jgi:hypothetical protein
MMKKKHALFIKKMLLDTFLYLAKGGFIVRKAHLLSANGHNVPHDFLGVCVASNANPDTDTYIISELKTLGIKRVRLDFTYEDIDSFHTRFLQRLIAENFVITLHLIAPYDAADNMHNQHEQLRWQQFLTTILDRFGTSIQQVEIGNTINRKRWSGYNINGFLVAWDIAYKTIKARNMTLLGPNIQDFEPMYNISLLKTLQAKNQIPDVHTDNLFVERAIEPERYDHRIFKYQWTRILKYNLIKKARLLQRIGHDFGVQQTASSAAFWAIYRIKRILPDGEQKQADYLVRYFTLLAASGALQQANWGALICHREGLINDGLSNADYPSLERIAHYQSADGALAEYTRHPSFYAMQTLLKKISNARYQTTIANGNHLEIHHFTNANEQYHIAWTTNGKVAYLADIYSEDSLKSAKILNRDGMPLERNVEFIYESPIYLCWEADANITIVAQASIASNVVIHPHIQDLQYFRFNENGWLGLVLAKDTNEAEQLIRALHPDKLNAPNKAQSLRHARNAIWATQDPRNIDAKLTVKQPIKMYTHKAFLDRFKPSKAKRSWNGAIELLRRGIGTAQPIAYFEKVGDKSLKQNFYICEHVQSDFSIGEIFAAFARGEPAYHGLTPEEVYKQFAQFCQNMHGRLVFFRDFSGGNILVKQDASRQLSFSLIDTARLRTVDSPPFPMHYRLADLVRACHKLHKEGRERFMQIYLGLNGKQFGRQAKLAFFLYDCKVKLKRTIGRKGIKKLIKRIKGIS